MSGRPNTVNVVCTPDEESRDYLRLWIDPKGKEPLVFRISRGGAELLAAEISGALAAPHHPGSTIMTEEIK